MKDAQLFEIDRFRLAKCLLSDPNGFDDLVNDTVDKNLSDTFLPNCAPWEFAHKTFLSHKEAVIMNSAEFTNYV